MLKKFLAYILIYAMILNPALAAAQQTVIVVDPGASPDQQPHVLPTQNGTPQVNISQPNSAGLSHNKYQQFDIGGNNAILNNSHKNVQTQLGGWIEGNPNLAGGSAQTILNEVNSSNPSLLKGFVEVAGQKADVIIANPSGISVDGGGFINAGRATLTTGRPQIENGRVKSFRVDSGHIAITGRGLNAEGSDYADIISKSAAVNAGIWANDLKISTGSNIVSADHSVVTSLGGENIKVSLDVSELGGMYAGHIRLVGTDKGLGVRNAGNIAAQIGEVVITSNGRLENSGFIGGQKSVSLNSGDKIKNAGRIQSPGEIKIESAGSLINQKEIVTNDALNIKTGGGLYNSGDIYSASSMSLTAMTESLENSGRIISDASLSISARKDVINSGAMKSLKDLTAIAQTGSLVNSGGIMSGEAAALKAETDIINTGEVRGNADLFLTAETGLVNSGGLLLALGQTLIKAVAGVGNSGEIHTGGPLKITAANGAFANSGVIISNAMAAIDSKQYFSNSGEIKSAGDLSVLVSDAYFLNRGLIHSAGGLTVSSSLWLENQGTLRSVGDAYLAAKDYFTNSVEAYILSGGLVSISSNGPWSNAGVIESVSGFTFSSVANSLTNSGRLTSNGPASIIAGTKFVNLGRIGVSKDMSLTAVKGDFENSGKITAGGTLNIGAETNISNTGEVVALDDMTLTAGTGFVENSGEIAAGGHLTMNAFASFLNNNIIESAKNLVINVIASSFSNYGRIVSGALSSITSASGFVNENHIQSLQSLIITAGDGRLENSGSILSGASAVLNTAGDFTNTKTIHSGGDLEIKSGSFINSGKALSGGNFTLSSLNGITNSGSLKSSGTLQANSSAGAIDNSALIFAGSGGEMRAALDLSNQSGASLLSGGDLAVTVNGKLINSGELSLNGRFDLKVGQDLNNSGRILAGKNYITAGKKFFNTGLLDGDEVIIRAADIENVSSGTILGGHVGLAADNILNGLAFGQDGEGTSGLIGARDRLDIGFSGQFTNRENGLVYSAGSAHIGGGLDDKGYAFGKGGTLLNSSAMFDIGGSLYADLNLFHNYNAHYSTRQETSQEGYHGFQFAWQGDPRWYSFDEVVISGDYESPVWGISSPYDDPAEFYRLTGTLITVRTVPDTSRPAMVEVGNNFYINGSLTNDKSVIKAGGLLNQTGGNFNNIAARERTVTTFQGNHSRELWEKGHRTHKEVQSVSFLFSDTLEERDVVLNPSGKRSPGNSQLKDNGGVNDGGPVWNGLNSPSSSVPQDSVSAPDGTIDPRSPDQDTAMFNIDSLNKNMYTIITEPNSRYLVESNPRLTSYRQWLGSDFMLSRLNSDPNLVHKRLGDGFYEQRLIREQISKLTGMRFLSGYANDEEQFAALMTAGVEFAKKYDLVPGVALTAEQMAGLTTDIVWLETVTVMTENGPVKALAPKVYLAPGREGTLTAGGGLISAADININTVGHDFNNQGRLAAHKAALLTGDDLNNSGDIAGTLVGLSALRDINNIGGSITAVEALSLDAKRDINILTTTRESSNSFGNNGFSRLTNIDDVASLVVKSKDGLLAVKAGGDISLRAALIDSAGSALLSAGKNLDISTVTVGNELKVNYADRKSSSSYHLKTSEDVGSLIKTGSDLVLAAGEDLAVTGSQIYAGGNLHAQAGRDIAITEGRSEASLESSYTGKTRRGLSKTTTSGELAIDHNLALGSGLSGDKISIIANQDLTVRGSDVAASSGLDIYAGRDISISGAENDTSFFSRKESKKFGLSGGFSGGRLHAGYEKKEQGTETSSREHFHTASLLGSEKGDVNIYAKGDASVSGSHLVAGTGDLFLSGENVTIDSQYDVYDQEDRNWVKKSGVGFSLGLSGALGDAVNNAVDTYHHLKKAKDAKSDRASALYGIAAARDIYNLAGSLKNMPDIIDDISSGNPVSNKTLGLDIGFGLSKSSNESGSQSHTVLASGSSISSGKDTYIIARGDDGGQGGDLNIIGSQISSGGWTHLKANKDLNILSAEELSSYHQYNKSSGSSAGISAGISSQGLAGISLNASGNRSKGSGDGDFVEHKESIISGSEGVSFSSGGDTLIKGGQILGDRILGSVGGDLSIISEQDTGRESWNQSSSSYGASVSIYGAGNNSLSASTQKQNARGNYDSVNEQSGIFAGSGGFDITVDGGTKLVGSAIDSKAEASKNKLETATLEVSDIENRSEYQAKTKGLGMEIGRGKAGIIPNLPMKESGSDSSVTRSAIAEAAVNIKDGDAQLAKTGKTAQETLAELNRDTENAHQGPLAKNPNLKDILDKQADIADAAGQAGKAVAQTIGDIAQKYTEHYEIARANKEIFEAILNDPDASAEAKNIAREELAYLNDPQALADYEKWKDGGINKALLHAAGAAIIAQVGNGEGLNAALGAMAGELASGKINEFAREMAKNITKDSAAQETLANLISSIAANAIGAAAGGESGASAAANADKYNRQLHPEEWEWLQDVENQKKFVEYVCENEPSLCADGALPNIVAEAILLRQALRQVDFSWRYFLGNEQGRIDELASDFLLNSGKTIKSTFGTNKAFVAANDAEYLDYRKYLDENKPYLNDLRLFTAGFMRQDTSVAKLQLLMLVASIYGADNIGMGPLPGDNKADYEAILKDAFHEARRTIPMISAGQMISDMKEILSAVEYYKNNGCDGDIDCAIGKAQVEPLIDSISRKYKKFAKTGKNDLELLDKVYNDHYMSVGQIGEDLAQVAILLATKKIADKTANIKANKNKLDIKNKTGSIGDKPSSIDQSKIEITKARFGHTFDNHGADATDFLTNRANAMNKPQGQFLDNQIAAQFIEANIHLTKNGAVTIPLPEGFPARLIMPDGTYAPAKSIRLVPGGKGVKTSYPE